MTNDSRGLIAIALITGGIAFGSEYLKPGEAERHITRSHTLANGYDVEMTRSGIAIGKYDFANKEFRKSEGILYAIDKDNDGRFDEISLENAAIGSGLEKLANLETLRSIANGLLTAEK